MLYTKKKDGCGGVGRRVFNFKKLKSINSEVMPIAAAFLARPSRVRQLA
jgi:hypothetical protein